MTTSRPLRAALALALLLALPFPAAAVTTCGPGLSCAGGVGGGTGGGGGGGTGGAGGLCGGGKVTLIDSLDHSGPSLPTATTLAVNTSAAGRYVCSLIRAPCSTAAWTRMAGEIVAPLAASVSEVGIFTADGATRIASTGPQSSAATALIAATGLSVTLTSGTQYLLCFASSATGTLTYRATNASSLLNLNYVNTAFLGGITAAQVAPFNVICSASVTPYTCCTGAGTGTCNGMADRTGVPAIGVGTSSSAGPVIQLAP